MTFGEFLASTCLPSTARDQLPAVLSQKVKNKHLLQKDAEKIITLAIDEINNGSIENLETLIKKRLGYRQVLYLYFE